MKHEWRKKEKDTYLPKEKPVELDVPAFNYLTITGQGNPNSPEFAEKVQALYALSYTIRMMPKGGVTPEGYFEYTVYPLEGLWNLTESGRQTETLDKDELIYKIMIRQPEFITEELVEMALDIAVKKKKTPLVKDLVFERISDGLSVQMLHVGPFEDESRTFAVMQEYIDKNDLSLRTKEHREIYLTDFNKTEPSKLKTTLRYRVERK